MKRFVDDPALVSAMGTQSRVIAERKYDVRQVNEELLSHAGL